MKIDGYINVKINNLHLIEEGFNYGEILLYSVILSFYENSQECFISNEGFAKMFHTSKRNIQIWLKKLKDNKLIRYEFDDEKRYLYPTNKKE